MGDNYTMYITGFPCPRCFAEMMQCGVRKVIYGPLNSNCIQEEQLELVKKLSERGDIQLIKYEGRLNIDGLKKLLG